MYFYKIFKNMSKKNLELLKYKSDNDYLDFLEVERKKGNIKLILNNEVFKDSNHYIKIHEIKVISNEKYEEITIKNNGIIKIETDTLKESKDYLTRIVNEIFGINCYANIQ